MMKYDVKDCKLLQKRELAKDIFDFVVEAPDFAAAAQAGQFAHIYVPGKTLRRPISICGVDRAAGTCLLYTSPSPRDRTRSRMPSSA